MQKRKKKQLPKNEFFIGEPSVWFRMVFSVAAHLHHNQNMQMLVIGLVKVNSEDGLCSLRCELLGWRISFEIWLFNGKLSIFIFQLSHKIGKCSNACIINWSFMVGACVYVGSVGPAERGEPSFSNSISDATLWLGQYSFGRKKSKLNVVVLVGRWREGHRIFCKF